MRRSLAIAAATLMPATGIHGSAAVASPTNCGSAAADYAIDADHGAFTLRDEAGNTETVTFTPSDATSGTVSSSKGESGVYTVVPVVQFTQVGSIAHGMIRFTITRIVAGPQNLTESQEYRGTPGCGTISGDVREISGLSTIQRRDFSLVFGVFVADRT